MNIDEISAFLQDSPPAIVVNQSGRTLYVNPAAEMLFGYQDDELFSLANILPIGLGKNIQFIQDWCESNLRASEMKKLKVVELKDRKGVLFFSEVWMSMKVVEVVAEEVKEEVDVFIIYFHDITAEKQALFLLEKLLRQACGLELVKRNFLANLNHAFLTELNIIMCSLDSTVIEETDSEKIERLRLIINAAERLHALILDLMKMTSMQAGKVRLDNVSFDISNQLSNTCQRFVPAAHEKGLEVLLYISHEIDSTVVGDPLRMMQIVANLLSNAVKFTKEGEIIVRVELTSENKLSICVTDTGIGVSPEKRDEIFDLFVQADGSMTREYAGVGLGLAANQMLATLMGGGISLDSTEGRGSTFRFVMPYVQGQRQDAPVQEGSVNYRQSELHNPLSDVGILIVGGSQNGQKILRDTCAGFGASATIVQNLDVLNFVSAKSNAHVLLLDHQLLQHLGDLPERMGFKVIVLTKTGETTNNSNFLQLSKPVDRFSLLRIVLNALDMIKI